LNQVLAQDRSEPGEPRAYIKLTILILAQNLWESFRFFTMLKRFPTKNVQKVRFLMVI